jgi:hypothetical protein
LIIIINSHVNLALSKQKTAIKKGKAYEYIFILLGSECWHRKVTMRLNKSEKSNRGWTTASGAKDKPMKPKFVGPDVFIGRVSSDMLDVCFRPRLKEMATASAEAYAEELLIYHTKLREHEAAHQVKPSIPELDSEGHEPELEGEKQEADMEVEIEADGSMKIVPDIPPFEVPEPVKPLFHSQFMINEFLATIGDVSDHFSDTGGWKVHANAAKFERALDEKYGVFRPFVTNHPEIEVFIRSIQRKYAMGFFSPFRQGSIPIPKSTSVIILFMMQRQSVRWDALILSALFLLVGLQPWALVACVAVFQQLVHRRCMKPVGGMKTRVEPVEPYWRVDSKNNAADDLTLEDLTMDSTTQRRKDFLLKPVGTSLGTNEKLDVDLYDTIIIGSGPGTLYAGALLARAGRKILVLSPGADASGCITLEGSPKYANIPFDIESSNIGRLARQQELLAPALCTSSDYQGGVRFAQIGTEADGHAFEILSIPGIGVDDAEGHIPFVLRARGGQAGFMDDTATYLGDGWPSSDGSLGSSVSGMYIAACTSINASAGAFYLAKILPENSKSFQQQSQYQDCACRYAATLLNQCFPLNPHLRSLMAGIGNKVEDLKPSSTSLGAHVSNICAAMSGEGMYYPVGGPRSLCHALASVIEQCGGRVATSAQVKELLFEDAKPNTTSREPAPPRCVGVKLFNDLEVKLEQGGEKAAAVINMRGFIDTFVRLLPEDIRTAHKVPMGLPALAERRPVFKVLFALKGSADELSVTGADYYRLPSAAIARDSIEPTTGAIVPGEIGGVSTETDADPDGEITQGVATNSANQEAVDTNTEDPSQRGKRSKAPKKISDRVKYDAGVSWMHISFPSAKDPSWEERHGSISTCVVTIEADDDFVVHYDTKPKLYSIVPAKVRDAGSRSRLMDRVRRDLLEVYPQLEGESFRLNLLNMACDELIQ